MSASGKLIYGVSGRLAYGGSGKLLYADRYLSELIPMAGTILGTDCKVFARSSYGTGATVNAARTSAISVWDAASWSISSLTTESDDAALRFYNTASSVSLNSRITIVGRAVPAAKWLRGSIVQFEASALLQLSDVYPDMPAEFELVIGQLDDLDDLPDTIADVEAFGDVTATLTPAADNPSWPAQDDYERALDAYVVSGEWIVVLVRCASPAISSLTGPGFADGKLYAPLMRCSWPLKS